MIVLKISQTRGAGLLGAAGRAESTEYLLDPTRSSPDASTVLSTFFRLAACCTFNLVLEDPIRLTGRLSKGQGRQVPRYYLVLSIHGTDRLSASQVLMPPRLAQQHYCRPPLPSSPSIIPNPGLHPPYN